MKTWQFSPCLFDPSQLSTASLFFSPQSGFLWRSNPTNRNPIFSPEFRSKLSVGIISDFCSLKSNVGPQSGSRQNSSFEVPLFLPDAFYFLFFSKSFRFCSHYSFSSPVLHLQNSLVQIFPVFRVGVLLGQFWPTRRLAKLLIAEAREKHTDVDGPPWRMSVQPRPIQFIHIHFSNKPIYANWRTMG